MKIDLGARQTILVAAMAIAVALAVAFAWFHDRRPATMEPAPGIVVVDGQEKQANEPATTTATAAAPTRAVPPELQRALQLPANARLKEPIPGNLTGSILCGEISVDGGPYRRFVFNRAGTTGAIDDGTELFRRFSTKICEQQR